MMAIGTLATSEMNQVHSMGRPDKADLTATQTMCATVRSVFSTESCSNIASWLTDL